MLGTHEIGLALVESGQTLLEGGETEEVVVLVHAHGHGAVVGTEAVDQVLLGVVGLTGGAVEPRIRALVDVARFIAACHELLHEPLVFRVGRPDEEVVGSADFTGDFFELRHDLVHVLFGCEAACAGRLLDLGAVLVGAGEEEDVLPQLPVEPGRDVGRGGRVGVPDVRHVVDVIDRSGDVEAAHSPASLTDGLCAPAHGGTPAGQTICLPRALALDCSYSRSSVLHWALRRGQHSLREDRHASQAGHQSHYA